MIASLEKIRPPDEGSFIEYVDGAYRVPSKPIIAYIEGDGIGPEVVSSARRVLDAAVEKVYGGSRRIIWWELYAGYKAEKLFGTLLPEDTLRGMMLAKVTLKGPLETPIGTGHRSINVAIRQKLDLYSNIRPVRYFRGVPAPSRYAEKINLVIFRENTEDVYAGIEWQAGSREALKVIEFLHREFGIELTPDTGIGVKPISEYRTKRHVRKALRYAIQHKRRVVTLMHKGNIMKYTEGAFMNWGYEVALSEFREYVVTEKEVAELYGGNPPPGKIVVNDRVADNMFQQIITRPWDYDVIVTPNLNGDYLSDAASALVGGIGIAPGLNAGDIFAFAEPVHGTAPKYAGKNVANPSATILAGAMLLEHIGWVEASELIWRAVEETIASGKMTQDLARHYENVKPLSTTEFTEAVIETIKRLR
ncbi:MAG: isocitrate dehydrogenase (NADP(+)) [Sulfolobales archaeon]